MVLDTHAKKVDQLNPDAKEFPFAADRRDTLAALKADVEHLRANYDTAPLIARMHLDPVMLPLLVLIGRIVDRLGDQDAG